eukprot:7728958-Heterocapsa_arctica.AAC.1
MAAAGLLAAVVGATNMGIGSATPVWFDAGVDSPTGWVRNLMQDGDIEHQPGPGHLFNASNFPGLFYEGTLRHRKLEGLLI